MSLTYLTIAALAFLGANLVKLYFIDSIFLDFVS